MANKKVPPTPAQQHVLDVLGSILHSRGVHAIRCFYRDLGVLQEFLGALQPGSPKVEWAGWQKPAEFTPRHDVSRTWAYVHIADSIVGLDRLEYTLTYSETSRPHRDSPLLSPSDVRMTDVLEVLSGGYNDV